MAIHTIITKNGSHAIEHLIYLKLQAEPRLCSEELASKFGYYNSISTTNRLAIRDPEIIRVIKESKYIVYTQGEWGRKLKC